MEVLLTGKISIWPLVMSALFFNMQCKRNPGIWNESNLKSKKIEGIRYGEGKGAHKAISQTSVW